MSPPMYFSEDCPQSLLAPLCSFSGHCLSLPGGWKECSLVSGRDGGQALHPPDVRGSEPLDLRGSYLPHVGTEHLKYGCSEL